MARVCELTGTSVQSGHTVSHSQIKTKRKFLPNLHMVTVISEALGQKYRFRVTTTALKTIEIKGGFDKFLLGTKDCNISKQALRIKKQITDRLARGA